MITIDKSKFAKLMLYYLYDILEYSYFKIKSKEDKLHFFEGYYGKACNKLVCSKNFGDFVLVRNKSTYTCDNVTADLNNFDCTCDDCLMESYDIGKLIGRKKHESGYVFCPYYSWNYLDMWPDNSSKRIITNKDIIAILPFRLMLSNYILNEEIRSKTET